MDGGLIMNIEQKLLKYKRELEETQSKIDQEKGALNSIYESLSNELNLEESEQSQKYIEKMASAEITKLNKLKTKLSTKLDSLINEIEEELEV